VSAVTDEDLVGALCDIEEGLSEWEVEFADSIYKWWEKHGFLTTGQRKKAEEIWEKFK
jgi:hypothetical protein